MTDLVSDRGVAAELAASFLNLDMSGALPLPAPGQTNVPGTLAGVNLSNALRSTFDQLDSLIDAKAENLNQIAQALAEFDAMLARTMSDQIGG